MMKRFAKGIMIFSIVFGMAALTGCGGGEEGSKPAAGGGEAASEAPAADIEAEPAANPITADKTGIFELEGTISNINTISNTFDLNTKEGKVPIQVRVMSRLIVNGERVPLRDVKSGSHAKGTYKKWSGQDAAMEIVITPK